MTLLIIAIALIIITSPLTIASVIISYFQKNRNKKYFLHVAMSLDQHANVFAQYWLNWFLIKPNGYKCGNIDETVSSVLGKNKKANTLTKTGLLIANILNRLETNHVEKAIEINP